MHRFLRTNLHMMSLMPWLLVGTVSSAWTANVPGGTINGTLHLAFLGASKLIIPGGGHAGFNVAIQTIKERQLLSGYSIDWHYWDSECNPNHGMCYKRRKECGLYCQIESGCCSRWDCSPLTCAAILPEWKYVVCSCQVSRWLWRHGLMLTISMASLAPRAAACVSMLDS